VSSGDADHAMTSHTCERPLCTGCLSGLPQHATAHLAIDAYRRAKVDDLNAASLDSDFHLAPGTSRGIVVGSKSDTLESGPAMAGTIESELVTVPGRSGFVIARWNRHIEAALARKKSGSGGRGAQSSDSAGDSAISGAVLGWRARVRGCRAHPARVRRIFVPPLPGRALLSLTIGKIK